MMTPHPEQPGDNLIEAVLYASRVLVAVAAESLAEVADQVTLPQYRTLVVLATRGALGLGALADTLGIHPSTATRQCDRLVAAGLIRRTEAPTDRRAITLSLTTEGNRIVEQVTERRRAAIANILSTMTTEQRNELVTALTSFAAAAGEIPPEQSWSLGWTG